MEFNKRVIIKSDRQIMKESLKQRKWPPSFISLVNMLAGLSFSATWTTLRVLFWTHSQIELSQGLTLASGFRSHVVWPLYASVIVVIQDGGRKDVIESVAIVRNTAQKIPKVHHLFQGSISSLNLGLTQAERGPFLTFSKPSNEVTVLEINFTIYISELEER